MSIWAVIPAKVTTAAKSRLSPVLSPAERARLAQRLLSGTTRVAVSTPTLAGVVVVTSAPELRRTAAELGAVVLSDPSDSGRDPLNAAIAHGCRHVAALGASGALILPADLPLLASSDIDEFLEEAGDVAVAIAPDRTGTGTNALLLRPPLAIEPSFGPRSCMRHRALAAAAGLSRALIVLPSLAFDLDTPDDLRSLGLDGLAPAGEIVHG